MKFIKKNMSIIVAIVVFILVVTGLLYFKEVFTADDATAIYGSRLDGREEIEIPQERISKLKDSIKDSSTKTTVRIAGRLINVTVEVKDDISLKDAQELGTPIVYTFTEEEREYYDIQIFLVNKKNTEEYPSIGYKHHTKPGLTWTSSK
jgi:hypothetical protein